MKSSALKKVKKKLEPVAEDKENDESQLQYVKHLEETVKALHTALHDAQHLQKLTQDRMKVLEDENEMLKGLISILPVKSLKPQPLAFIPRVSQSGFLSQPKQPVPSVAASGGAATNRTKGSVLQLDYDAPALK